MLQGRVREGLRQVKAAVGAGWGLDGRGGRSVVTHPGSARTARAARRLNAPGDTAAGRGARVTARALWMDRLNVGIVRMERRVVDRWWTNKPIRRRFFDLVLETGENTMVFHDDDAGTASRTRLYLRLLGGRAESPVDEPCARRVQVQYLRAAAVAASEAMTRTWRRGDEAAPAEPESLVACGELDLALEQQERVGVVVIVTSARRASRRTQSRSHRIFWKESARMRR